MRYQDVYPSDALLRSFDVLRPRAADLVTLEYFEAPPAEMPYAAFAQHHLLLNLKDEPHRVENRRDGTLRGFTYRKHEIVLTPAGMTSGWRWHATSRVIVVTLDPDKLERFARTELGVVLTARQLKDVPQAEDADLCRAGELLLDALRGRGPGSEVLYESLARVLLVKLIDRYGEARAQALDEAGGLSAERYKRVLDLVEARFAEPLTLEDLAGAAALSPAHFSRLFKATLGDSPWQFVMEYRIEQAKKMLADRARSLGDVAHACGFADQPHFTRVFKKLTGFTPSAFRAA